MNVATPVFASMTADDPMVLLMGAVSVVIILAALYRGGWKHVTHHAVCIFGALVYASFIAGGFFACCLFYSALFGSEEARAGNFLGAVIITASVLVVRRVVSSDNVFMRLLSLLMLDEEENEG